MDSFDFSLLFRSTIGFDRLFRLLDATSRVDGASPGYPPYNIEKTGDDAYRLTMAVAGFSPSELDVTVHENTLLVTGKAHKEEEEEEEEENGNGYLHRVIARRAFSSIEQHGCRYFPQGRCLSLMHSPKWQLRTIYMVTSENLASGLLKTRICP